MINSGRNIVLMLVGVVMVAALVGASQGGAAPAKSKPKPAPAATASPFAWAEVLEQNPDPKVVTDADFLKRITETKLPWRVKDKASGIEMLLVPPGKFVMGMSPGDSLADVEEKPAHEVTITKAFYLGRTEVTQEQWKKVMGKNPSQFQDGSREKLIAKYMKEGLTKQEAQERAVKETPNGWAQEKNPVENVSWDDCQKFCAKTRMKLPTEAQWEYACRAGVRKPRYGELDQIAWYENNSDSTTHPVAKKAPNSLGFYDMIGNVWEWTNDLYEGDYYKSCADGVVDPTGPAQSELGARAGRGGGQSELGARVLRGGGWSGTANGWRASDRYYGAAAFGFRFDPFGCRFARTAD
jgi:formylglycine-generating enzyme required for sulfatase activity